MKSIKTEETGNSFTPTRELMWGLGVESLCFVHIVILQCFCQVGDYTRIG